MAFSSSTLLNNSDFFTNQSTQQSASGLFGAFQNSFNAKIEERLAGLSASESRLSKGQLLKISAVDKQFLIKDQEARRGAQVAGFAKGGVRIGEGSALNIVVQQARIDMFNQARFDFNVATQARNLEIQAQQADYQKKLAKFKGYMAIAQGAFSGASLGLGAYSAGGGGG